MGRTQAMQLQKGLVQGSLHDHDGFHGVLSFIPITLGKLLHVLEEGAIIMLVLQLQDLVS